jgi:hypothetical protein
MKYFKRSLTTLKNVPMATQKTDYFMPFKGHDLTKGVWILYL